jgi:hypothetical protein
MGQTLQSKEVKGLDREDLLMQFKQPFFQRSFLLSL